MYFDIFHATARIGVTVMYCTIGGLFKLGRTKFEL